MTLLTFLGFILIIWSLAYLRTPSLIWTPVMAGVLVAYHYFHLLPLYLLIPIDLVFLATATLINFKRFRQHYISEKAYDLVKQALPPMSATEREALEAGDVWWEKELFCGQPNWHNLLQIAKQTLTSEEQAFLDNQVNVLCSMLDEWTINHRDHDLPPAVWNYIKTEKFWAMAIDKQYGGLGFSAYAHSCVIMKIASRSINAAISVMVPNSLGPAELLQHYGTEQQKEYYLPRLARGQEIPCFALTEPTAGSDAAGIQDYGIVCRGHFEGKEIIGLKLTWNKRYITLAPVATVLGLAVKVTDPEHLLGNQENIGITLCLIPTRHPGVKVGERHFPMGMAFMNGPTSGQDVFIPLDWIIGGDTNLGQGWRMLMECLSIGRAISLPALSAACGEVGYLTTSAYTKVRTQFKISIGQFEGIALPLAYIGATAYLEEATRLLTVAAVDNKIKPSVASAITKYHLTERARKIVNDAMDIHGGRGLQWGPRNYLGHGYCGLPIAITVEGANILTRNLIIFGQGALRCHPYLRDEMAIVNGDKTPENLAKFDKLFFNHVGYTLRNIARTLGQALTFGHIARAPVSGPMRHYYQQLTRMSSALAFTADMSFVILGGQLKRKEALSARLGDILSELYMSSAVLRYYHQSGSPAEDVPYVQWLLQDSLYNIQNIFYQIFENFPNRIVSHLLKAIIFPLGRSYKLPKDKLSFTIADQMQHLSALRERLTRLCYIGDNQEDPIFRIENAFRKVIQAEPFAKRIALAIKKGQLAKNNNYDALIEEAKSQQILSAEEADILLEAHTLSLDAIQVDEFTNEELSQLTPRTQHAEIS